MIRLGVLASGGGSNLQALLGACAARSIDAEVALVVANVPGAGALSRAERAGIPSLLLPSKGVERAAYDAELVDQLRAARVDLVCLAGFMRLLSPGFLEAFGPAAGTRGCPRVVNIHPSLLPAFPGLKAQAQCLAYGARFAGCTVHFVDQGVDTGPIIAQALVPVLPDDDEAALTARVLSEEHRLYPQAVGWYAAGRLSLEGRRIRVDGARAPERGLSNPVG